MKKLDRLDEVGLVYLLQNEPVCIGTVDDDPKFAAAVAMEQLKRKGRAVAEATDDGPSYRLTPIGRAEAKAILSAAVPA